MFRHLIVVCLAVGAIASGCKCDCGGSATVKPDAGPGTGSGDAGGGGGDAGTNDGGTTPIDAGDGTTTGGVDPGGWLLDGGTTADGGSGGLGEGVKVDPNGHLVLNSGEVQLHFAWIANSVAGTVSKFDTKTGKEVGRYHAVVPVDGLGNAVALRGDQGNSPSRTAVDLFGDVWIANRAPGVQGSVTKIANDITNCRDRNANGTIETSRDVNNDGVISTNPADGEFIVPTDFTNATQYDECILFSTPVGGAGSGVKARAIAIAKGFEGSAGDVWVGVHEAKAMIKLSAANGQQVPVNASGAMAISLTNFASGPYGAAVDGLQRLWVVDALRAHLALIDTATGTLVTDTLSSNVTNASYGIGIDGKNRVWLAGWNGPHASRYDHGPGVAATPGTWTKFDFSALTSQIGTTFGRGRGIAADDQGFIWMSAFTDGNGNGAAQLVGFNGDDGTVKPFTTATGQAQFIDATDADSYTSIGVGLDSDANIWVNNYSGNAIRVNRTSGDVLRTSRQPGGLYTYSDFTGYQLRKFTAPRGTYRHTFEGCGDEAEWLQVLWDADTPLGTSLQVYVKVANAVADLDNNAIPKYGPFTTSPADLKGAGVPKGKFLRVEFVLISQDQKTTPVLKSFNVKWSCMGIIN